tara:strand:+ start:536 stop:1000 length:465 start_codon:yes stop_codon:yes gene_type:complete
MAFCNRESAVKYAYKNKDKGADIAHKQRKKVFSSKDKKLRKDSAQSAFNAYIRYRDKDDNCISCGRNHTGQYHAGHYKSRGGHCELAFEELNCHKQCSACNNHLSANLINYRINLIKKIGIDKVDWLEGPHELPHYTCEDLKEIELYYKAKLKE